jgi:hypothetical protein
MLLSHSHGFGAGHLQTAFLPVLRVPQFQFYPTNEPAADMMKASVSGLKALAPGPSTATITRILLLALLSQRVSIST